MSEASSRYHHGNLREALLTQAHALLVEEGVSGVSLRQVAARAGVSRTAPYHHFKDKESLLAALVQRGFQQLVDDTRPSVTQDGPVLERFRRMGAAYIHFALREPPVYRLMFGPNMLDGIKHPEAVGTADEAFDLLRRLVEQGQQAGEISGDEPLPIALTAWSTVHGLASLLMDKMAQPGAGPSGAAPMSELAVDDVIDRVMHTLTEGLRVR